MLLIGGLKMGDWIGGEETKPDWDDYYMAMAYMVAQRSVDESTVHGAVLVSADKRVLSIGYNGPIRETNPNPEDLKTRPNKYWLMLHAEENCIMNYHGSYSDLIQSTMYITGEPCHRCLRMILQKGIRRIIYGCVGSKVIDEQDTEAKKKMIDSLFHSEGVLVKRHDSDLKKVKSLLNKTLDYIDFKEKQNG